MEDKVHGRTLSGRILAHDTLRVLKWTSEPSHVVETCRGWGHRNYWNELKTDDRGDLFRKWSFFTSLQFWHQESLETECSIDINKTNQPTNDQSNLCSAQIGACQCKLHHFGLGAPSCPTSLSFFKIKNKKVRGVAQWQSTSGSNPQYPPKTTKQKNDMTTRNHETFGNGYSMIKIEKLTLERIDMIQRIQEESNKNPTKLIITKGK